MSVKKWITLAIIVVVGITGWLVFKNGKSLIHIEPVHEVEFETLKKGNSSGVTHHQAVTLRKQKQWNEVWKKMNSIYPNDISTPTEVDFDTEMLIVVFAGDKSSGGHDIEIVRLYQEASTIVAVVENTSPSQNDMVTTALTQPYHIIKTKKSDKEVIFKQSYD